MVLLPAVFLPSCARSFHDVKTTICCLTTPSSPRLDVAVQRRGGHACLPANHHHHKMRNALVYRMSHRSSDVREGVGWGP